MRWFSFWPSLGGLAHRFYPFVAPERLTTDDDAAAPKSIQVIAADVIVVLPIIIASATFAERVLDGKGTELSYN